MDDDIDIEEHDVLDNPAIRSIFPDISQIKKEISTYNDDENFRVGVEVIKKRISTDEESTSQCSDEERTQVGHGYSDYTNFKTEGLFTAIENTRQQSCNNKIILGSRPMLKYTKEYYEAHVKPYSAQVCLKDIGTFLSKSCKFCRDCKIYFPQRRDLKTHKQTYHKIITNSVSSPITRTTVHKRYRCEICLKFFFNIVYFNEHMNKIHKQSNIIKTNKTRLASQNGGSKLTLPKANRNSLKINSLIQKTKSSTSTVCFHCKETFPSKKNLIEHIYKILQSAKNALKNQVNDSGKGIKHESTNSHLTISNLKNEGIKSVKKKEKIPPLFSLDHITEENNEAPQNNIEGCEDLKLFYKCQYCTYYFKGMSFYVGHLSNKHKEYSSSEINRVKFEPKCKFCSTVSSSMHSHNSHMQTCHKECIENIIKVEPEIRILKIDATAYINQNQQNKEAKIRSQSNMYKSKVKIYKRNLQSPITNKSDQDINLNNSDENGGCESNETLVLKTVLFKCTRCDINFLSAKTAMNHLDHMEILINWKCSICQKIFKKNDEIIHIRQHSFSDVFVVYELNECQLSNVLYKCTKCSHHFTDDIYASHYDMCGTVISDSSYCKDCDILIERSFMQDHTYEHKSKKASDFTIVCSEVLPLDPPKSLEKKIKKTSKKKPNRNVFLKMCYCETCKCFLTQVAMREVHRLGDCVHLIKYVCRRCGLVLTNKTIQTHRLWHRQEKQLKLQDFIFYDLKTGKRICPPVPEYPKCESCNIHFLSKMAIINHVCNQQDFLTCPVCEIKLAENVFKLHVAFHNYCLNKDRKRRSRDSIIEDNENLISKLEDKLPSRNFSSNKLSKNKLQPVVEVAHNSIKVTTKNNPDLILERNETDSYIKKGIISTTHLEQITYSCSSCFILVNSFDKAVEHCQDHYNDINFEIYLLKCEICKINYDKRFSADHKVIHDFVSGGGFTNLIFDVFYFATDYKFWIQDIFQSIDPNIVHSILDRSIYKYEGRVKLNVVQEGSTKFVVYKCNGCRIYIDPNTILSHSENSCFRQRIHPCSFCGLPFISHMCRINHELIHKNSPTVGYKSYKIVSFDRNKDQNYITKILFSRNCFILYKCRGCNGTFNIFQNRDHCCNTRDLKKCLSCELLFYNADFKSHSFKHTVCRKFTARNMRIIFFGRLNIQNKDIGMSPSFKGNISDYLFLKCAICNLCCTIRRKITNFTHDCTNSSAKIKCLKCDIYLLKIEMNQHVKRHETDPYFIKEYYDFIPYDGKTVDVVAADSTSEICESITNEGAIEENDTTVNTEDSVNEMDLSKVGSESNETLNSYDTVTEKEAKIYKCNCGLHFLDRNSIRSHFGHCSTRISIQNCSKCNLRFTPKDLFAHLLQHHGDKQHIYKMNIIEMSKHKNEVVEIYKCSLCDVHFAETQKAKEHNANCRNVDTDKKKCEVCNLYFDQASIDMHKIKHHAANVADTEVVIISAQPDCGQFNSDKEISLVKEIENLMNEADAVCRKDYKISREFLAQINVNSYSNIIYKCQQCNIHFNHDNTFRQHLARHEPFSAGQDNCNVCGLNFSLPSLAKHIYVHHKKMKLDLSSLIIKSDTETEEVPIPK